MQGAHSASRGRYCPARSRALLPCSLCIFLIQGTQSGGVGRDVLLGVSPLGEEPSLPF